MKKLSGFTLVELLISLGIMSFLIVILSQLFSSIVSLRQKSQAVSGVAQDSRYLSQRLGYDIRRADAITTPSPGNTSTSLVLSIDGDTYTYAQEDESLTLSVNGGTSVALNSSLTDISSLNFVRSTQTSLINDVSVSFTVTPTTQTVGAAISPRIINTTYTTR